MHGSLEGIPLSCIRHGAPYPYLTTTSIFPNPTFSPMQTENPPQLDILTNLTPSQLHILLTPTSSLVPYPLSLINIVSK